MIAASIVGAMLLAQHIDPQTGLHVSPLRDFVTLTLSADRQAYFAGERVRLTLTARNMSETTVSGHLALNPALGRAQVLHRTGGTAFTQLRSFLEPPGSYALGHRTLAPDEEYSEVFDLAVTTLTPAAFVLDRTGVHEFKVVYDDAPKGPNGRLESNILSVDVIETPPDEREAQGSYTPTLAYLAQVADGPDAFVTPESMAEAAAFIDRYRRSRYAGPVKEGLLKWLQYRMQTRRATDDEASLYRKLMRSVDTVPPELHADVYPAILWPPNRRLVQVFTSVSASDVDDPNPTVRLESVTCDDACVPASDIAGATLGSDDREFELRAERKGSGTARTYTITYSVTDASGNRAFTTATVVVPHDQSKK